MRSDSAGFQNLNQLASRDPVFVVEIAFDSANTDLHYLCSRAVNGLTGNIINDTLQGISSTSQKISPEKALSTIGTISFECLDIGLTDLQRTKLQAGDGLKGKRIRVYKGFVALDWSDYALIQTQVISDSVSFKDGVYTFQCADVQRVLRKNIFEVKETSLSQSLNASDTVINVYDTSQFEMIKQPSSPSGLTDAPNQTVGYLKIEQGDDVEIIRYSGKTSGTFTGCVRGVLGTKAIDVEVNATEADKSTKVTEYVYLEMAAPKLIYALLTGVQYGQAEGLPEHWHLGVAPEYIKTSDFLNIGSDWWDVSNNDNGVPAVLRGVEKEDGKKFIEEELLVMLGAFMPIYANGEVGLKRMTGVLSQGGFDKELNEDNVVRYGELKHDLGGVINQIIIAWNFVEARDGFTRRSILVDPDSIERNGKSKPLELNLRALETSRHSYSTIKSRFDALRDRYAGAPLRLQLTLAPTENELEIGDIVRVNLPQIEDFTQSGVGLNRNFEVQRVTQDWIKGSVKIDLFGSSAVASPVPEESGVGSEVVDSGFFSSSGTEISPANFGAAVTDVGGVTTVVSNISLTGGSDINSSDSIFYCDQDLTINEGVTVTIISNVQIRAKGFFQLNGKIDGKGRGFTGGLGVSQGASTNLELNYYRSYGTSTPFYAASNFGTRGFIDPKFIPQRGGFVTVSGNEQSSYKTLVYPDLAGEISQGGSRNAAPSLDLKISGTQLSGLPSDLRGSSGVGGGVCVQYESYFGTYIDQRAGSDGGASGAGLVIVCSGADIGANGVIDTSGEDAAQPSVTQMAKVAGNVSGHLTHSSGTGGACGACYWLIVGASSTAPTLNQSNSVANIGGSKADVNTDSEINFSSDRIIDFDWRSGVGAYRQVRMGGNNGATISMPFYGQPLILQNAYQSCHKIQYVNYASAIEGSVTPVYAEDATFTLTEFVNSPETATQNRCTVEVSITPPSDTEYSYSKVEYRKLGSNQWSTASPSSFESVVEVERDGSTYEFRIRSVSSSNKVSPSGEIKSITVSDIGSFAPDAPLGFAITEELYQTTTSNVIKLRALISWSEPVGKTQRYDVQYRRGSGSWLWVEGNLAGTSASVDDLAVGDHEFRIRPLSVLSQAGDWLTIPYTMLGKVAPPPKVDSALLTGSLLSWKYESIPIDHQGYLVRFHAGDRSDWDTATPLHDGVLNPNFIDISGLVSGSATFLIKAVDTSGSESTEAAIVFDQIAGAGAQNAILEHKISEESAGVAALFSAAAVGSGNDVNPSPTLGEGAAYWSFSTSPFGEMKQVWTGKTVYRSGNGSAITTAQTALVGTVRHRITMMFRFSSDVDLNSTLVFSESSGTTYLELAQYATATGSQKTLYSDTLANSGLLPDVWYMFVTEIADKAAPEDATVYGGIYRVDTAQLVGSLDKSLRFYFDAHNCAMATQFIAPSGQSGELGEVFFDDVRIEQMTGSEPTIAELCASRQPQTTNVIDGSVVYDSPNSPDYFSGFTKSNNTVILAGGEISAVNASGAYFPWSVETYFNRRGCADFVGDSEFGNPFRFYFETNSDEVVAKLEYALVSWPLVNGEIDWQLSSGYIGNLVDETYLFRISVAHHSSVVNTYEGGQEAPNIRDIGYYIDMPDKVEIAEDLLVSSSGSVVPLSKTYQKITHMAFTVQEDGSGAASVRIVSKSPSAPTVRAYNSSGVAVSATIDVLVRGY